MTVREQFRFWLIALLSVAVLLWLFSGIMLPFVAGFALAYLLDPIADRMEKIGMSRLAASIVILGVFLVLFLVALVAIAPVIIQQLEAFLARLPEDIAKLRALAESFSDGWVGRILNERSADIENNLTGLAQNLAQWLAQLLQSVLTGGLALVNFLALFVITPVVAFYMLVDWDRMVARIDELLPRDHHDTVVRLAKEIDEALSGFVRGQSLVCLLLGLFYAGGLTLLGLNFGLLIGLIAGLISFIPYIGSISGFLISISIALVQFWPDWTMVLAVAAVFFAGQALEGNVLQPKLVGGHVGLHPVSLMFALFAFGYLFGFVGMLLAVPIAAAIGVLMRFAIEQYLASPLYGDRADGPE